MDLHLLSSFYPDMGRALAWTPCGLLLTSLTTVWLQGRPGPAQRTDRKPPRPFRHLPDTRLSGCRLALDLLYDAKPPCVRAQAMKEAQLRLKQASAATLAAVNKFKVGL